MLVYLNNQKSENIETFSQLFNFVKLKLRATGKISPNYANFLANEICLLIIMQKAFDVGIHFLYFQLLDIEY